MSLKTLHNSCVAEALMKDLQCEFCTKFPTMKFTKNYYVRYCCNDHKERLRRLLHLDLGIDTYSFEKVKPYPESIIRSKNNGGELCR